MQIGTLLEKLQNVKMTGDNHWSTNCPCPGHTTPGNHLSISLNETKILLKCFGTHAHSAEEIVSTLGLELKDLFLDTIPSSEIIAEYSYCGEDGNELFQVVKYEPKAYRQRRRDATGEWQWNLKGIRRVIYHLPDIITEKKVWLTEGEKDADNLWKCGLVATTSPGGASNWKPQYAEALAGKEVCIIPDNDLPGYQYALAVAESLKDQSKVSVILLPEGYKDISDYIEKNGYDLADLEPLETTDLSQLVKLSETVKNSESSETVKDTENSEDSEGLVKDKAYHNVVEKVKEWLVLHEGERFNLDTICRQLDLSTATGRKYVATYLSKLRKEEKIEFSPLSLTPYIYIPLDIYKDNLVKWEDASDEAVIPLRWPEGQEDDSSFGFDESIQIAPGDLIIVAGLSNMGKTSIALNFLMDNLDLDMPKRMLVNEYSPSKFKQRVNKMWWAKPLNGNGKPRFELMRCYDNWKRFIVPDGINIIDWMNLDGTIHPFYEIGSILEGIQHKLTSGICMVLIQKEGHKDLGRGGGFTRDMSSFYLAMDFERLTVVKAKAWSGKDPNFATYGFKLSNAGTLFSDIRPIKKCSHCYGSGKSKGEDCGSCGGTGWIDK